MINLRLSVEAFVSSKLFFPFKEYGFLLALINEEQTSLYFTSQGSHIIRILQFETFFSNNFELSQSNGKMHVYKKVFDLFEKRLTLKGENTFRFVCFMKYLVERLRDCALRLA